jgi:PAS domain S-box-containing protein
MDTDLQHTLLQLFQQVGENPDKVPVVSVDAWQKGSMEWQLLTSFRNVLDSFQQSRQDLQKSEERFSLAVRGANDGLWDWDLRTDIVYFSPRWKSMLGYEDDEIPHHFNEWLKRVHPEDRERAQETIQDYLNGRTASYRLEHRLLHKDGTYRWILARGVLQRDKDGIPHRMAGSHTDITERKQAEEQLREKEAQYRSIFEATTDVLLIVDLEEGCIVEANPAACKVYGYAYEELIGLPHSATIHPNDRPYVTNQVIPLIKSGGEFFARGIGLRKDGTTFHLDVHNAAFIFQNKLHLLVVIRDITEQVQAEEQLRQKEKQYRSIFEATTDALFIIDLDDGDVVEANPAACKIYGYTYDEFIGLPPSVFIHPDKLPNFLEKALPSVKAGGEWHARGINLRKDGTSFPIDVHLTSFTYQDKPHMLVVGRDITEQVKAEEQLREKEAQYRSIFEASTDGLVINDLEDGHPVEVNPAMCRMHGYTYEEFMMLHPMNFIHPDSHALFAEYINTVKAGKKFQARAIDMRKDGTPFPVEVHGTTFDYKGKPHVLAVVRDVTEQVQAYELLEQRVEERTRELTTLLDISHNVASYIELKPLLATVLDQLRMVADYTGSSFSILEGEDLVLVENRCPAPLDRVLQLHIPIKRMGIIWEMFSKREPVSIPDVHDDSPLAQAFRTMMDKHLKATFGYIRSWMAVPLSHKEQIIGMLTLSSSEPDYYTPRHASLALAIADQAAVALANARLYEQAQELAALEERQRLARELHDSVSQALYGITLGTHTARTLLQRDPSKVAEPLDYVLSQAEAALTEMRALIFELRPESLETEGLVAAISRQAAALHARHEIVVSTELCDEPELSLKAKEELYRVAQEALHNTVKHARAKKVNVCMRWDTDGLLLEVCDDGVGFDTARSFPGHLGLHSMQERITRLGGTLRIESTPGQGTCICAQLPAAKFSAQKARV